MPAFLRAFLSRTPLPATARWGGRSAYPDGRIARIERVLHGHCRPPRQREPPIGSLWHVVLCALTVIRDPRVRSASKSDEYMLKQFDNLLGALNLAFADESRRVPSPRRAPGSCESRHPGSPRCRSFPTPMRGSHHPRLSTFRFPRHAYIHKQGRAAGLPRLAELPDPGPGAWRRCQSSGVTFRRTVFQVRGGERQRLPNILRFQLGIVPKEVVAVGV